MSLVQPVLSKEAISGLEAENPFLDVVITAEFTGPTGRL
ncbi:MAG: DUF5060 domain-containing protein [Acutalibacter muris]|nr:DUF5060 domain-containing protein [Acutalibacter muris]MCI9544972.1 DUF5060 domain-containing protein [Acutalibacter muris]